MKNGKIFLVIFQILLLFLIIGLPVFATSDYVLPYPSYMPGSFMYKVRLVSEKIMKYWYFGSFSQFTYNLKQSDKYLVEAKTLFEYKQYLLGLNALQKSDKYFLVTFQYLKNAKAENKDISEKYSLLKAAAKKHIEILTNLEQIVPREFLWRPEKSPPTNLYLKSDIEKSIKIRMTNL